jgi:DNA polymerase III epsilon subunit-like protein
METQYTNPIVFDTETTGLLPTNTDLTLYNLDAFPSIVQLSWLMYNVIDKTYETHNYIIRVNPDVVISQGSIDIHGITHEKSQKEGYSIDYVMNLFMVYLQQSDLYICHNTFFDYKLVKVELLRLLKKVADLNEIDNGGFQDRIEKYNNYLYVLHNHKGYCTMKENTNLCKLSKFTKKNVLMKSYKWPTLKELHFYLFGTNPNKLHDAMNDVMVCFRCYYFITFNEDILTHNAEFRQLYSPLLT